MARTFICKQAVLGRLYVVTTQQPRSPNSSYCLLFLFLTRLELLADLLMVCVCWVATTRWGVGTRTWLHNILVHRDECALAPTN